jgi:uncharacterized protein (TIGR03437 family)
MGCWEAFNLLRDYHQRRGKFRELFAPGLTGAFTTIFGKGLAATTRSWTAAELTNGQLLRATRRRLGDDGRQTRLYLCVSPSQIDVIAPRIRNTDSVQVV